MNPRPKVKKGIVIMPNNSAAMGKCPKFDKSDLVAHPTKEGYLFCCICGYELTRQGTTGKGELTDDYETKPILLTGKGKKDKDVIERGIEELEKKGYSNIHADSF